MNERDMNEKLPDGFKMTELGPLPEEWEVVRLGDVVEFNLGRTPKRSDKSYWADGKYSWVSIADMNDFGYIYNTKEKVSQKAYEEVFKKRLVPKETLLMSFKLTIGRTSILKIDAFHNEAIISIYPNKNYILKEFLFYFLPTINFSNYYDNVVKGKTLNSAKIKKLLIPLPPLSEQKKIAAVLSAVQSAKEKTEAVIKAAKELKKSLMKHLFTYGPVSPQDAENVPLKETEIGLIPEEWEVVKLGDIVDVKGGKRLPKGHSFSSTPTPYPYIRVADFSNWSVKTTELKYLTPDDREVIKKYIITHDDVYISIAGTIGLVGSIPLKLNKANLTENAARLIIRDPKRLDKLFLIGYLASKRGQYEISTRTSKTSQPKLALNRIKQIPAPLPPLPVQQKIASILSAVDKKIEAEENKKKALEDLFKTLLHNLMTAKIRVNQLEVTS